MKDKYITDKEDNKAIVFLRDTFNFDFTKYDKYKYEFSYDRETKKPIPDEKFKGNPVGKVFKYLINELNMAYLPSVRRETYYDVLIKTLSRKTGQNWEYEEKTYQKINGEWELPDLIFYDCDDGYKIITTLSNKTESFDIEFGVVLAFGGALINPPKCLENDKIDKKQAEEIQNFLDHYIFDEYTKKRIEQVVNDKKFLENMKVILTDAIHDEKLLRYGDNDNFIEEYNKDIFYDELYKVEFETTDSEGNNIHNERLSQKYKQMHDKNIKKLQAQYKALENYEKNIHKDEEFSI